MFSSFTGKHLILLRFLKLYSKSQRITVCLCVIVKMAKMKNEEAVAEKSVGAFSMEESRWTDAEKT